MHIFYVPEIRQGEVSLDKEEAKHAIKVLRLKRHDNVTIVDGKGNLHEATIMQVSFNDCTLRIDKTHHNFDVRDHRVHIALAPTKNIDRIEWFVEKSVELGIEEISFIRTFRSERKQVNLERLQKIAISAMKQSIKATLPKLNDLMDFRSFIASNQTGARYIAHLKDGLSKPLKEVVKPSGQYLVIIGPEGDLTEEELQLAISSGFAPVSLGRYRLRTETAALAACHILNIINE